MTMTLKIEHVSGDAYQARIKADGDADRVLKPGQSCEVGIYSSKTVTITEETHVPDESSQEEEKSE